MFAPITAEFLSSMDNAELRRHIDDIQLQMRTYRLFGWCVSPLSIELDVMWEEWTRRTEMTDVTVVMHDPWHR